MTRYFYGASHEEFPPEALLRHADRRRARRLRRHRLLRPPTALVGAGRVRPRLGVAGRRRTGHRQGPVRHRRHPAPGARYHPALIAQAWMTFERMYPGRPYLGIGSGEALNEVPRRRRLALDRGSDRPTRRGAGHHRPPLEGRDDHSGRPLPPLKDCKLHSLADRRPPIWVSAFGPQAAEVAGRRGDGLWTLPRPRVDARGDRGLPREAGGDRRDRLPGPGLLGALG